MIDLHKILERLSNERPIFHSEADFQHALAWKIHKEVPNVSIRLERPFRGVRDDKGNSKPWYIDIFCFEGKEKLAIELKYKTKALEVTHKGERFILTNQSAQDVSRYDFIKDIVRLERLYTSGEIDKGFALFLTNDELYWKEPRWRYKRTNDYEFRIHEGRFLSGTLKWAKSTGQGTKKGREDPLKIGYSYRFHWRTYSQLPLGKYREFKYLLVKVPP